MAHDEESVLKDDVVKKAEKIYNILTEGAEAFQELDYTKVVNSLAFAIVRTLNIDLRADETGVEALESDAKAAQQFILDIASVIQLNVEEAIKRVENGTD